MHDRLFEAALGITTPWSVKAVRFDEFTKVLSVQIDFKAGTRFAWRVLTASNRCTTPSPSTTAT